MLAPIPRSHYPSRSPRHPRAPAITVIALALSSLHCSNPGEIPGDTASPDLALCRAPASLGGSPETIEDVTILINALAAQHDGALDLPCFVASLDRPLGAAASSGFVSAQPAEGERSPRLFLWSGALVLSVAPEGIGLNLLELGYQTSPTRSIKAEILFPVKEPLSFAAPYDRILYEPGTRCAGCHAGEEPAKGVTWARAFESEVLRPSDSDLVDLGYVDQQSKSCDPGEEAQRCAVLRSVFDQGGIHSQSFSRDARTLYGDP
jgi:hypothetical protein